MTTKTEIIKPSTVKVYELDDYEKLLKGVKVAACMITESHQVGKFFKLFDNFNVFILNIYNLIFNSIFPYDI